MHVPKSVQICLQSSKIRPPNSNVDKCAMYGIEIYGSFRWMTSMDTFYNWSRAIYDSQFGKGVLETLLGHQPPIPCGLHNIGPYPVILLESSFISTKEWRDLVGFLLGKAFSYEKKTFST